MPVPRVVRVRDDQKRLPGAVTLALAGAYFGLTIARNAGWVPASLSFIPVVEAAWLNFVVVLAAAYWMRARKIPLASVGIGAWLPWPRLFKLALGVMAVDYLAIAVAAPVLNGIFGEAEQVARFAELPGNLPLLLLLLPLSWLIAAFGEEFFFRGFLLTLIAQGLGASRTAWITAVLAQAIAFGLIHGYQGPAEAISIGIGGAVYGAAFLMSGRNLWPLILAHGINNTLGFVLVYAGVLQR